MFVKKALDLDIIPSFGFGILSRNELLDMEIIHLITTINNPAPDGFPARLPGSSTIAFLSDQRLIKRYTHGGRGYKAVFYGKKHANIHDEVKW